MNNYKYPMLLVLFQCFFAVFANAQIAKISTIAGTGIAGYTGNGGLATLAKLDHPHGLIMDVNGNIYIADKYNSVIRKISPSGIITTIAGTGIAGHTGDGGPATLAQLNNPFQLAFDAAGNIYFCEESNYIRKISTTGIISSIAGTGVVGSGGDGGPATLASFNRPEGLAIDASGNIYISDFYNEKVRVINTSGIISTFAGTGVTGYSGDGGPATAAKLSKPNFLFFDHLGNLFISDNDNHAIRKVTPSGIISTFAGGNSSGFSGDGGLAIAAQLNFPCGICEDANHNIYISDLSNNRIRKVDTFGIISTVVGNGTSGYSGDGGPALAASLNAPAYTYLDSVGDLYISDHYNSVIRKVKYSPTYISDSFKIYVDKYCSGPNIIIVPKHNTLGMYVKSYFGDGGTDSSAILSNGNSSVISHVYVNSGTYTIKHVLHMGAVVIDSFHYTYSHTLCNSLSIKFYYDGNNNCQKDTNDVVLSQPITIEVDSNGVVKDTLSATSGFYYTAYGSVGDVYAFKVLTTPAGMPVSCPSTAIIYDTLGTGAYASPTKNVGLECSTSSSFDLSIHSSIPITGTFDQQGTIYIQNAYCAPVNATVTLHHSLKYPGVPNYVSPTPTSINTDNIVWNINSLSSTLPNPIPIHYVIYIAGTYLTPGDTVHSFVTIDPSTGDANVSDNTEVSVDTVKAGCDPNEMWVTPACVMSGNIVNKLQYKINFENTGNDTAHNIYVMDTLSNNIDISSMRLIMSSHEMYTSHIRDSVGHNIIKFDFPHINLLDSSHHGQCDGTVIFTVNSIPGVVMGSDIYNRAGIYFDVNPVVLTNNVATKVGCPVSSVNTVRNTDEVEIYPNPVSEELIIKSERNNYYSFSISNMMGQILLQQPLYTSPTKVNVRLLPAGLYYITLTGQHGNIVKKVIKTL